jgi:hypothetical protein
MLIKLRLTSETINSMVHTAEPKPPIPHKTNPAIGHVKPFPSGSYPQNLTYPNIDFNFILPHELHVEPTEIF